MVSSLVSRSSDLGLCHGREHCVVFLVIRFFTLTVPLSTQLYIWVPGNLMQGGNPALN